MPTIALQGFQCPVGMPAIFADFLYYEYSPYPFWLKPKCVALHCLHSRAAMPATYAAPAAYAAAPMTYSAPAIYAAPVTYKAPMAEIDRLVGGKVVERDFIGSGVIYTAPNVSCGAPTVACAAPTTYTAPMTYAAPLAACGP